MSGVFATLLAIALFVPELAVAQNWTGSMRCEISVDASGYSQRETQTWTLTGAAPTQQGAFEIYPATWTVTGQGRFDRSTATSRRVADWTASVPGMNAPIAFHVTPAGRRVMKLWHSMLSMHRAYSGTEQYFQQGAPLTPKTFEATVYEWQPSPIEVAPADTRISGSQSTQVRQQVGPVQSPDTPATVVCTWSFGRGTAEALPPSTLPLPSTTPVQTTPGATPPSGSAGGVAATTPADAVPPASSTPPVGSTPAVSSTPPATSTPPAASTPPGSSSPPGASTPGGENSPPGTTSAPPASPPLMTAVPLSPGAIPLTLVAQVKLLTNFQSYWAKGQEQRVAWTHTLGDQALFDVDATFDDGATWTPLATRNRPFALPELGAGVVGVKVIAPNRDGTIRLRVRAAGQETPRDESRFRISLARPVIGVVRPGAGDRWVIGASTPPDALRLSHNLSAQASFKVELSHDGGVTWTWIGEQHPAHPFVWRMVAGPATTQARIRVTPMHAHLPGGISPYSFVEGVSPDFTIASAP